MEHICEHHWYTIPPPCVDIGLAFLEHYTQIDNRHVDSTHRQSPSPNKRSILPSPVSRAPHIVRSHIPSVQDTVCRADLPRPQTPYTTINVSCHLLHMERGHFPGPRLHTASPEEESWMERINISTKCRALLYSRMYFQSIREMTATAAWLRGWEPTGPLPNPPHAAVYLCTPTYVRMYAMDMAYIPPPNPNETIYSTLHTMATAATSARAIRIETMHPNHNWPQIWRNLHDAWIPDMVRSVWYATIHDIMLTKERLHRIALMDTNRCTNCGQIDTLLHRVTDCGARKPVWNWTRTLLARILNTRPQRIPDDWTVRPQFHTRPPQRHGAMLWILAHLVYYRTPYHNPTTLQDYSDFLRRARWKAHNKDQHRKRVGNYLHMIYSYMACIRTTTPDTMKLRLDPQILSRSRICNCDRTTQNYTFLHPLLHT